MRTPRSARLDDPSPGSSPRTEIATDAPITHRRHIITLALVTSFVLVAASPAAARKNDGLKLRMLDSTDQVPNWAEDVTFDVTTNADQPFVNLRCAQGDALVYDGWAGFYPGAWFGQTFTLSSAYWSGGDADCNARLVKFGRNGRERVLAKLPFHVYA